MGLGDTSDIEVFNPLVRETEFDKENPHIHLLSVLRQPDYFGVSAKLLLGLNLAPFQLAILHELWHRCFPMLIGSRGASKSFILAVYIVLRMLFCQGSKVVVVGAAFRQSKVVFEYCETIYNNAAILRDLIGNDNKNGPTRAIDRCVMRIGESVGTFLPLGDGCLSPDTIVTYGDHFGTIDEDCTEFDFSKQIVNRNKFVWAPQNGFVLSDEAYCNSVAETKKVITQKGFTIEGTNNHKIKILRNQQIQWERLDNIKAGDYAVIDKSSRWHSGKFECTVQQAYALGLMIGDGCWTNQYTLGYSTIDEELISGVRNGTGFNFTQCSDKVHFIASGKQRRRDWMKFWGLNHAMSHTKELPAAILHATKECMSACIRGIFDTDGTLQVSTAKGGTSVSVSLTTTSVNLAKQIHFILLHYGIVGTLVSRQRQQHQNRIYELFITGKGVKIFANEIGFGLSRKQSILLNGITAQKRDRSMHGGVPAISKVMSNVIKEHRDNAKQKYHCLAPSIISKAVRVSKSTVHDFISAYGHVDVELTKRLQELANESYFYDEIVSIQDGISVTYDIHVPNTHEYTANGFLSHNTKIRGQRANILIGEEYASIPKEIFENVVSGFAAVSLSPVEKMKAAARRKAMKDIGMLDGNVPELAGIPGLNANQTILSGTAYWGFNHFCDDWKRYKAIIDSRGEHNKLEEIFQGEVPEKFDWRDYSVIRLPVELLPDDFMDEKHVSKAKATLHRSHFLMEFSATFPIDSHGFFKRSLIENCVAGKPGSPINMPSCGEVIFSAIMKGDPTKQYVIAIDPASEYDNFSITIIEIWPEHRRIVHAWTTTRAKFRTKLKQQRDGSGPAENLDDEFYGYIVRKIHDLIRLFPTVRIAMDSQGGGVAVMEALGSTKYLLAGEMPILPIIEEEKEKDTDNLPGLHILEMVNFARAEWVSWANHGLRQDMENKVLIFPRMDPVELGLSYEQDKVTGRVKIVDGKEVHLYDTLEDCMLEIEELKDELATIVHTQTGTSLRDRWDTPETKLPGGKKGRMRKDRYSSLLMANAAARLIQATPVGPRYSMMGGFASDLVKNKETRKRPQHNNPSWYDDFITAAGSKLGAVVRKK